MARKIFYMIRHGETVLNAQHIRQGPEGPLSDLGINQSIVTGKRLSKMRFDAIICSPYQRTVETAKLVVEQLKYKKEIEYSNLLVERKNPSEIIGKSAELPEVAHIVDIIDKSFHDNDYRYSDEENFNDLKTRAGYLLKYLSKRPEKKILIITHSIFLKMVAAYIEKGEKLNAKQYNLFSYMNTSNNASITICEYNSGWLGDGIIGRYFYPLEKRWRLVAWDDYYRGN